MKSFLGIAFLMLAAGLHAQTNTVDTNGWTSLSSGQPVAPAAQSIDAGQAWIHAMPAADFRLRLELQSSNTDAPDDWPVIEIGSLAVAVGRSGSKPALFYASGTETVDVISDSSIESNESVIVFLERSGADITIRLGSKTARTAASTKPEELLVLSAGTAEEARLKNLKLETAISYPLGDASGGGAGLAVGDPSGVAPRSSNTATSRAHGAPQVQHGTVPAEPKKENAAAATASSSLEVITPPAVRPSRAEHLRAMIENR